MNTQTRSTMGMGILVALTIFGTQACTNAGLNKTSVGGSVSSVSPSSVSLKVLDSATSALIYNDTGAGKTFSLVAGKTYVIKVANSNLPLGATVSLVAVNTSLPNASPQTLPATGTDVSFTPSVAGDYAVRVLVTSMNGSNLLTKDYAAGVSCQMPTFTANSLSANGISINGSDNLYAYSAAGVVAGANGQAPYLCAYDLTGVGIVDTGFTDCATPLTNQYSPLVQSRRVGVVVKDACNTSYTVSSNITLNAAVPTAPGNVFITGNISNTTGAATTDSRIQGAHYSAINTGGHNIVQPGYGGTTYTIQSFLNYGQASSIPYGMKIEVSGLAGTFNLSTNVNGNIDTSNATLSKLTYITDQAGDQNPSISLTSTTCTTSGIHAATHNPVGKPCTAGSTGGTNNTVQVEVWADYTCTNASSSGGASATVSGTFDGWVDLVDSCQGGGGGGGGIVPIKL